MSKRADAELARLEYFRGYLFDLGHRDLSFAVERQWEGAKERREIWYAASCAAWPKGGMVERRQWLAKLAELAGWAAIISGQLPPPVTSAPVD